MSNDIKSFLDGCVPVEGEDLEFTEIKKNTYAPADVTVSVGGQIVEGFSDSDGMVEIPREALKGYTLTISLGDTENPIEINAYLDEENYAKLTTFLPKG